MSGQSGQPNRAGLGSGDSTDSAESAEQFVYFEEVDECAGALRDALRTPTDDDVANLRSYREVRERLPAVLEMYAEECSDRVLLMSVTKKDDGFWEGLTQSFLNRRRGPRVELVEIRDHVRRVWGEDSSAEAFLDDLLTHVAKSQSAGTSRLEEMSLGELRSAVTSLDSNDEVDRLAFWFSTGEQALMALRLRLPSDGKEDERLRPEQLSEVLGKVELSDSEGCDLVEPSLENVFPCFIILRRLRRLAREQGR